MVAGSGFGSINSGSPFHDVEVQLQDSILSQNSLGQRSQGQLGGFSKQVPVRRRKEEDSPEHVSEGCAGRYLQPSSYQFTGKGTAVRAGAAQAAPAC